MEEKKEEDVFLSAEGEECPTPVVEEDSNNNPSSVQNLTVPESEELGVALPVERPPSPLLLVAGSCAGASQKSVSTGSVNLEGLEVKASLGKTLSARGSEGKSEQGLDKAGLRRSLSDPDMKNRDHNHPLKSSSVLSRIRKRSSHKKHKPEKSETGEASSPEGQAPEPQAQAQAPGVEVAEEASVLDEAESQDHFQQAMADAVQADATVPPEASEPAPHSRSFLRRVSVKLKSSFAGKSKLECEEDLEAKLLRERARSMKERKVEVIDLSEDGNKKPCVRKVSVIEMCSARRAGRYRFVWLPLAHLD